jgi:hypothetical protein
MKPQSELKTPMQVEVEKREKIRCAFFFLVHKVGWDIFKPKKNNNNIT